MLRRAAFVMAVLAALCPALSAGAQADLLNDLGGPDGFGEGLLEPGDDGSSAPIELSDAFPNGLNFFGNAFDAVYVNNNGNLSFNGPLTDFTAEAFPVADLPMIAPWWADVDTRLQDAGLANDVRYQVDPDNGRFVATWNDVGYFNLHTDKADAFQVVLTDRSDVAPGDFDVQFRYHRCEWTQGDETATGSGQVPAQAGFDAGNETDFVVLPGSLTDQVARLCTTSNVDDEGVWDFFIRAGNVTECGDGQLAEGEECDQEGNTAACDGDCTLPVCGDGFRNPAADEVCDDGRPGDGDGCSASCVVEPGWTCAPAAVGGPDVCVAICGDGLVRGSEACDDGNGANGDGCSAACVLEDGFLCDDQGPTTCLPDGDGDGLVDTDDNCPGHANPEQEDGDGDGLGDACNPDLFDGFEYRGGGLDGCQTSAGTPGSAAWLGLLLLAGLMVVRRRHG